jgi:hypothetical protein
MFGTTNTLVPLGLTVLLQQKVDLRNMIFSSLICMMDGDVVPKVLFVGFLNFMVMEGRIDWVIQSGLYVLSVLLIHLFLPYDNALHKFVYTNALASSIFKSLIVLWMLRIGYLIMEQVVVLIDQKNQV